ncbi:RNA polymerase II elongation factor Ell [Gryllus bimaculatus]|nr:RNA polymerase II elongation factor Ell [Gryllus bimaculatus]
MRTSEQTEMAALMQGVQYGLSSQGTFDENKSLIFVKLTDSAFRAIEEYLRNKNRISATPQIQFLGNEGHLSFPSSNETSHRFTFNLTSNADIEGPQGSFECIQQNSTKNLENLGALQCKMRIQAKDDVYEATRHRMAVAEEAQKKNRERLIQMLAVRNYKKPELVDRLYRDGLRERDKKAMTDVLKQVSMLRDNTYQLLRHLWNDVQENWPFYSEQERQSLKR